MTISELLGQLGERGIVLACDGDELLVRSMKRAMDPALLEALRAHKPALRELIRSGGYDAALAASRPGPLVELSEAELAGIAATVPGGAANVQDVYPLAPLQEGILFHHLMAAEGDPYLMPLLFRFDTREDVTRYLGALQAVVDRHDILRTAVHWEGLPEPVQVVWRSAPLNVEEVALDPADGPVADQLRARFDLRHHRLDLRRAPLLTAHVAHDAPEDRWLLWLVRHHLISDNVTLDVLQSEIAEHLAGRADALPPPLPFRAFVARARQGVSREEHQAFFTEMLGDVDEPTAPFGLLDARGDGSGTQEGRLEVDADLAARLRERARALGVSAASIVHAAWARVLGRASGRDDVVFGTVLFGRMEGGEGADRVMGPFVNTLPVRIRVGDVGAAACVRRTHALLATLLRHEHASLALAQRCSGVEGSAPLFTALLNYRHTAGQARPGASAAPARPAAGGMRVIFGEGRSNYPLGLSVDDRGDGFWLHGQVAHASLDPVRVCRLMHRALEGLVEALETAPERPMGSIDVLPPDERREVVEEWNRTEAAYPASSCVHELFEGQAERTPDATALVSGDGRLTYAGLNARANALAHYLRERGVGPDTRVGICLERGMEMVVALLAVLKAGGAYVPLDPSYPPERLLYMLRDSAPVVLLTRAPLGRALAESGVPAVDVQAGAAAWADHPRTNPGRGGLTPDHLAYVIYTSGSTGRPKGVMVEHRGVCNLAAAQVRGFGIGPDSRVLQFASFSFDACVSEVATALSTGASLHLPRPGVPLAGEVLTGAVAHDGITHLTLPPAVLASLPEDADLAPARTLVLAGEAVTEAMARRWARGRRLLNAYGPTEATVCASMHEVAADEGGRPSIGRPLANARVYVLDAGGEPVPVGVAGELYVGGAGVARGYLDRPALTAERFVPDPFGGGAGARLYRTGDLGRWRADGTIEFLGRIDHQVKVRGFRIELGEIEARLLEHEGVEEAVVLAREDAPGEKRLVAYYVAGRELEADALSAHLGERLPEHMVPAAYVRLDALPLTPNGKLDRGALPAPGDEAYARRGHEPPVGETEQALADIWSEVLGLDRVGRWDDFFELGGHSLLAVQVISRVQQVLAVEVELGELFDRPVLADFARELETAARAELPPIEPAPRDGRIPLSFAQQRLWFLEQLGDLGGTYHVRAPLRLRGALDRAALVDALDGIVARHETLRTTFAQVDGIPEQRIAPADASRFHLLEHDLRGRADAEGELDRRMAEEAGTPFDLERGPLIRGRLIRLADDDHVLLVTMHHIVSDAWSSGVLFGELSALYAAHRAGRKPDLPPLPVQYADYAAWQRRWVEGDVLQQQADYWTRTLAGAPELLELPADHPRPAQMDHGGAQLGLELEEGLTAGLKALSRRHGTTLFTTLLAGWAALLGRLSGRTDVVVGTPVANRGRQEIEGLIGFFVNTLALRLDLSDAPTVAELLGRVKERTIEAQHHQDIPFEQVVELVDPVRSLSHSPLFQVMFAWQDTQRGGALSLPGLEVGRVGAGSAPVQAKFDLSLSLREAGDRIVGSVTYATALFERATVERYVGYLGRVLEEMAADELRPVERLSLLPADERARVVDGWNQTDAPYPADACVHALVEAQAARTPDAPAVVFEGGRLTYAALNARANRLARHLRSRGVGPDVPVGLCLERGPEMIVAVLAVLKAGGAYVPLDPEYPEDRLRHMLADSAPAVLLTQSSLGERFAGAGVPRIDIDADADADADAAAWADEADANPLVGGLTPDHLAYVIYTSGSTGRPKGVMNQHRALVNRLAWGRRAWDIGPDEAVLCKTSLNFDGSVREIFLPLMAGGRVVIARPGGHRDPSYLLEVIGREGVTTVNLVPSLLQVLLEAPEVERLRGLKRVLCGGEALPAALLARFREALPEVELHNLYGPSEAATAVTAPRCEAEPGRAGVPIGGPAANARVYVLDGAGEPVPVGVAGELYIGGVPVARGYLGRAALTAERFVPDPFGGEAGARLYRTGDLVRWTESTDALTHSRTHALEFVGRDDAQVKVRGFRVELGEIEARLREHGGVREAVVLAREDAPGDRRLVAYCVGDETVDVESLRAHLSERLPEYMVPAAYVRLDGLPLTPSGKVDRKALPAPEGDAYAAREYEAPAGETEEALAAIWAEVLRVEGVGRRDSFFDLGGHSLLAVQVVSRIRQALGLEVPLGELFTRPVLKDFARRVETAARSELPPVEPVDRDGRVPLSFAQQRLWFLEQLGDLGSTYHIRRRLRLRGALDRPALLRALDAVVARHEALRTTFTRVDGIPEQRIAPADAGFPLVEHDLGGQADGEAELGRLTGDEARVPFDLERGPLIRGMLIRMAQDDHVLLVTMHHIVSDAWSMGVFARELGALYGAFRRGEPDPLPPLPVQYADYAAWQRRWIEGDVLRAQADYWARTLADAPELLALPTDRPRPAQVDHGGARLSVELDEGLTAGLRALSRRHGTTLFMTLLAGWAAVLARLSGQETVVVGSPMAGRGRREIEGLIGFFVNTLALRVDVPGATTAAELLRQVKAAVLDAQRHQDIPFEQVVERIDPARSLSHHPLYQVLFTWQSTPGGDGLTLPGLDVGGVEARAQTRANLDLSLALQEVGDRITGSVTYATALLDRDTVVRYVGYLGRVLEEMVADDHRPVERLPLLPADERALVLEAWSRTGEIGSADACIHALFERQVEGTPHAVAAVIEGETLTYAELNARANRLAHHLRALGVGPDVRVGVCVERGLEMVVGLMGVLKAGGAYVPLDPGYPAERLAYMLADSAPAAVLTQSALRDRVEGAGVPLLELDGAAPAWADGPATNPARGDLTPSHLAYVIYTSGSTGRPKGVMNRHGAVASLFAASQREWGLGPGDAVLQKAPYSFDVSVRELFWPLTAGARVVLARPDGDRDVAYLVRTIVRERVTTAVFPPSLLLAFLEHPGAAECASLARVLAGGEPLSPALVERFYARLPDATLYHMYGPTETTVAVTGGSVRREDGDGRISIGRPVAGTRAYVLDAHGEPVPVGVAGELYVGGAQVARGYLGRPDQTAERFVADPFGAEPGARLYRTGDLARWRPDGRIDFLGRRDHQVKVRGYRVEPGEIEARLRAHGGVREAVVLVREDAPGDRRLVAYVVGDGSADVESLRAHLGETLPEYMVPAAYVRLDALPLTPGGKVDRRALPAPEGGAYAVRPYEAPVGETEGALAGIWSEVLGMDRVGRHDDFFGLGGHSLLAVQVVSRVQEALAVEVELGALFTRPVLADFARALETAARAELPPIEPAPRHGRIPLSFAQQRLWFMEQLGNLGSAYHMRTRLRLRGALDQGALVDALDALVARHEALRTTFARVDGTPEQRIAPADAGFHLLEHDLGGAADGEAQLARWMVDEAQAPFDLERGPLVRGRLVRLAEDDHVLLVTLHHIVSDGWSMGVLTRELGALYGAFRRGEGDPLPALPVQYADYAAWQRRWVEGDVLRAQSDYWARTLADAPELLELPTDHPRPAQMDPAGARLGVELDEALTAGLKALSRRRGTTLFMTLLAGWAAVLGRLSGQDDVVIGTPAANRGRREIEGLIGFFVNTLALRVDLSGAPTVAELLGRVKARVLEAQHHQDIPFEQVVERVAPARTLAHNPLYQAALVWQGAAPPAVELPGLALGRVRAPDDRVTAKEDLGLSLAEANGRITGGVTYATSLFDRDTVERWVGYLRRVLEEMAADDGRRVDRLALLPEHERRRVVEAWNATEVAYAPGRCLHELVEGWAARTPDAVALVVGDERLTYGELNARANRLAHHLRARGVGPEVRVGVCVERSVDMVVGPLAVLKAGGAYVPLDPAYPDERLRYMVRDSAPAHVLAQAPWAPRFAGLDAPVVVLDGRAWAHAPAADPARAGLTADHAAYVVYTSGSTGMPKGVVVPHRGVTNLVESQGDGYAVDPDSRVMQFQSFGFDACVWEVFVTLGRGAMLHVPPPDLLAGEPLTEAVARHGITHMTLTVAMLATLPNDARMDSVHTLLATGDVLTETVARRWARGRRLINGYGPTEATVATTLQEYRPGEEGPPPIGRPIANLRVYVLDAHGEPVPVGVAGEMYVGGVGVVRGYLDRPALTAERFVPDPFGRERGARLYRTGDLGRWRPDGTLEFAGRADEQVKVRGFRVEPGEVEARLLEHGAVDEAAVVARRDGEGARRLVAYWVGRAAEPEALRTHLLERLPEYMVPPAYVRLGALPLTPNRKVDRGALPAPTGDAFARRGYEAPRTETEAVLAGIWAEVLGVDRVGRQDGFFELGGHSLLAVTLVERMRRQGLHADVRTLFAAPTLEALAAAVGGDSAAVAVPPNGIPDASPVITPDMLPLVALRQGEIDAVVSTVPGGAANVQDIYPLAPLQEGLLFHHLVAERGDAYLLGSVAAFATRERLDAHLEALRAVVARHDVLRTSIAWEDLPEPVQVVWRHAPLPVEEVALDPAAGDVAEQLYRRFDPRHHRLDLRRAPLMRVYVARDPARERWVLLQLRHHLAGDHTAGDVMRGEIQAFLEGRGGELPAPRPFRDYVAQVRLGVGEEEHRAFFTEMLGDVDEPTAPFGLLDVRGDGSGIDEARLLVDEPLALRLRARARALGVSAATLCHLAWARVLAAASGREDVVFGTVLFGRMQGGEGADRTMGLFINTLPLRVRVGHGGAEEAVRRTHALLAGLMRHEHASLALAQRCSAVEPSAPLFTSLLNYRHGGRRTTAQAREADARAADAGVRRTYTEERSNYPFTMSVDDLGEALRLTAKVKAQVDARRVCAMMHTALEGLVEALETAPARPLGRIGALPAEERDRVLRAWNGTEAPVPAGACTHELIEAQAARTPGAEAVVFEGARLTYGELNARANRLAHHLRALGVGPDARVGICVERSLEMVVGLLAVLKAGGAYVPLDPSYPADRLAYMLASSAPAAVLTQARLRDRVEGAGVPLLALDADAPAWAHAPATDPPRGALTPGHLAYVTYTSGSTGRPKGVMNAHGGLVNRLTWMQARHGLRAGEGVLQNSSFSFDASVFEIFWPLTAGGRVVLPRPDGHRDPEHLVRVMSGEGVSTAYFVCSMLQLFLEYPGVERCTALARVLCGGEALSPTLARRLRERFPRARLHNLYGPTESAVSVTGPVSAEDDELATVPIGRPAPNVRIYLLDAHGEPAPVGVAGELYVGGAQLARGYLGRPDQTAERFVPDPFGGEPGARLYRTGDLGRWRADGRIEFLGRMDFQVKVRGFRIEPAEIEARLLEHPGVREAVVVAREDTPGDTRLVAYWVGGADAEILRAHVGEALPSYMVPSAYVRLDALPLTPNGKLDRKALPAPDGAAHGGGDHEPPVGETEEALAGIWAEVLGIGRVGRRDNFFQVGGHSLLATRLVVRIKHEMDVDLALRDVFEKPELHQLAQLVLDAQLAQFDPAQLAELAELARAPE